MSEQASEFGILGLTGTAQALALRLAASGCRVSLWDFCFDALREFLVQHIGTRGGLVGFEDIEDFLESLALPARAACFLSTDSEPAIRAAAWIGAGMVPVRLPSNGSPEAGVEATDKALLASLEARLLAPLA